MEQKKVTDEYLEPDKVDSRAYQCPSCAANMTYNPETLSLSCDYCGMKVSLKGENSNVENDFLEGIKQDEVWDKDAVVFHCKSCGADNIRQKNDLSANCPFCGSHSVVETEELPGIKPQRIIPFRISKETALANFQKLVKKSFFAPGDFKKSFSISKLNGVYLPSWTFDSNAFTNYVGRLGKYYTVTVGSGKNRHTETRIRWFTIRGTKQFTFDDILIISGRKIPDKLMNKILPYDTNHSFVYQQEYISGFMAEHYALNLKAGWDIAKQKAVTEMQRLIAMDYLHDVVDYIDVQPIYSNIKYKYVLLPVWISFYQYQNKSYHFLVNGENGKTSGKVPVSIMKVTILVLVILAIIAIAAILIITFGDKPSGNDYPYYSKIIENIIFKQLL